MSDVLRGACFCGAVDFELTGVSRYDGVLPQPVVP